MTLADIARIVSRRWRVVLVAVVVCLALGGIAGALLPKSYTASTSLVVSPLNNDLAGSGGSSGEEVNIRTEQEILGSPEVARLAAESLGVTLSPDSYLLQRTDVAAPSGSQVLQVSVTADRPQDAADAANALADAYLKFRTDGAKASAKRYIDIIDDRLKSLDPQDDKAVIASLEEQRQSLTMFGSDPGRIIGRAGAPGHPSTPGGLVFAAGGAAAGLLIGIFVALIRERTDKKVRSAGRLGHHAVLASGPDDVEAWRWVIHDLRPVLDREGPSRIAVYAAGPIDATSVSDGMLRACQAHGLSASVLEPDGSLSAAVDSGWPRPTRSDEDVQLVDLSALQSLAQVDAAAGRADAAVILAAPRSARSTSDVINVVGASQGHAPRVVFIDGRGGSHTRIKRLPAATDESSLSAARHEAGAVEVEDRASERAGRR